MIIRLFALVMVLSMSATALAQRGGGGGTGGGGFTGGTGGGTGGGGFTGGTGGGNNSNLSNAFAAGLSSGSSMTGGTGQQATQSGTGMGFGSGLGQTGNSTNPFAMSTNAFSFGGSNALVNSAVMGRSMGGMLGGMGGMSMGAMGMGGTGGRTGMGGNSNQNQSKIRASVRLGFSMPLAPADQRTQVVQTRFANLPLGDRVRNPQVSITGRTATIRGEVASQDDARLVERLLKLEPGIDNVVNQLAVAPASNAGSPPTATTVPLPIVPTPVQNN